MAKDRITICKNYISEGNPCKTGRIAEHKGYCQKCKQYKPRCREKHLNRKKLKLFKIKQTENSLDL